MNGNNSSTGSHRRGLASRRRIGSALAIGALSLGTAILAPGVAHADDGNGLVDLSAFCGPSSGRTCVDFTYTQNDAKSYGWGAKPLDIGNATAACTGQSASVGANHTESISRTSSWSVNVGAQFESALVKGSKLTGAFGGGQSITYTTSNGTTNTENIDPGYVGHLQFTPWMWHSEGIVDFAVLNPDGSNENHFQSYVTSDSPEVWNNGQAAGTYGAHEDFMTPDLRSMYCH